MRRLSLVAVASLVPLVLSLAACGVLPEQPQPRQAYDLGPLTSKLTFAEHHLPDDLVLDSVGAVPWLSGTDIHYRYAFDEPQQLRSYSRSRWIAPPAVMLRDRLNDVIARIDGVSRASLADAVRLQVTLERFEQVFDTQKHARAVLRARVSLSQAGGDATVQHVFHIERECATADAQGAVTALSALVDTFIQDLASWAEKEQHKISPSGSQG